MNKQETIDRRYTVIAIVVSIAIIYTNLSADCATGGSCDFANGDLANWLFPKLHFLEWAFWKVIPG